MILLKNRQESLEGVDVAAVIGLGVICVLTATQKAM
jgi:hypothetical protein